RHHSLDESVNVVIEDTQTEVKIGPLFVTDIEASVLEQVVVHFYQEQASDASGVRSANRTDPTCVPGQQRRGIDANMIDHGTHIYTKFLVTFPDCPVRDQEFTGSNIITLKQPTDINISSMSFGHGGACPVATSDEFAVDADIDNWFEISGVTSSDGILTYSMQTLLSGGGGGLYGTGYKWQGFSVSGNPGDSFTVTILLGLVDSTFTKQVTANVTLAQVGSVSENASSGYIEVHGEDLDVPEVQATVPSFVRLTALSYANIPPAAVSGAVYHLYQQQTFNTASVRKADITDTVIAFNYDANGLLLQDLDQGNRLVTHILVSFPACPARNAHLENIEEIMV
ncbi:MAG: hypothetical protein KAG66_10960, partial [Methylococcales bacterium]|nr:hypothetical protein [Methylococcales bacterium]